MEGPQTPLQRQRSISPLDLDELAETPRRGMIELLWIVGFLAVWILLQAVILPKLGDST